MSVTEHQCTYLAGYCIYCGLPKLAEPLPSTPSTNTTSDLLKKAQIDVEPVIEQETLPVGVCPKCKRNTIFCRCTAIGSSTQQPSTTCTNDYKTAKRIAIGLVCSIITSARVLAGMDLSDENVIEALKELRSDVDVKKLLAAPSEETPHA